MCVTVGWFQIVLALVGAACAATIPVEAPKPVTDTKEVVQAKAEFKAAYDAAAAAAEAAPDTDLDGMLSTLDGRLSPYYTRYGFPINAALPYSALPYAGLPGVLPYTALPYTNLQAALTDDIPATLPYTALPYAGLPYAGLPYAGLPYAGLPYAGLTGFPAIKLAE